MSYEHTFWSKFWSWSSGEILKLQFGQYFAADVWLSLQSWILAKILKLDLVKILSLSLVKFLKLKFDQDLYKNLWYELNPRVRCAFDNVYCLSVDFCCQQRIVSWESPR